MNAAITQKMGATLKKRLATADNGCELRRIGVGDRLDAFAKGLDGKVPPGVIEMGVGVDHVNRAIRKFPALVTRDLLEHVGEDAPRGRSVGRVDDEQRVGQRYDVTRH